MPIDVKSFSIFGLTSLAMALLNGPVPGSLVYFESFILAFSSVYLHVQNQKNGVTYEDGTFEMFSQHIPWPVVRYNKDGFPVLWNNKMAEETGYSYKEILAYYQKNGDIMGLFYTGENLVKVREHLAHVSKSGEGYVNVAFTMNAKS